MRLGQTFSLYILPDIIGLCAQELSESKVPSVWYKPPWNFLLPFELMHSLYKQCILQHKFHSLTLGFLKKNHDTTHSQKYGA